jgi:hypothetical protein
MVTITNIGAKMVPVDLNIYYKDGTATKIHKDISCWRNGNKAINIDIAADKPIDKLILGGPYDVDVNKANNVYVMKPL